MYEHGLMKRAKIVAMAVAVSGLVFGVVFAGFVVTHPNWPSQPPTQPSNSTTSLDRSIVGIEVLGCDVEASTGSGAFIESNRVITAAHVVRGATSITVRGRSAERWPARVVAFDPDVDLAVLEIESFAGGAPIPLLQGSIDVPRQAEAFSVRGTKLYRQPAKIRRAITIRTEDIYRKGKISRAGFDLDIDLVPGDSGGVLVVNNEITGVLWGRSRLHPGRGYAINISEATLSSGRIATQLAVKSVGVDVDPSRCR
jgi:Trypsin-like peptidase domain